MRTQQDLSYLSKKLMPVTKVSVLAALSGHAEFDGVMIIKIFWLKEHLNSLSALTIMQKKESIN